MSRRKRKIATLERSLDTARTYAALLVNGAALDPVAGFAPAHPDLHRSRELLAEIRELLSRADARMPAPPETATGEVRGC